MENEGIQIGKYPRCSKQGLLIKRMTVTTNGSKKCIYRRLNIARMLAIASQRMANELIGFTGATLTLSS